MFDSPFDRCPVCNEYVLLDQTQKECAREHRCRNVVCPLGKLFVGYDFSAPPTKGKGLHDRKA